MLNDIIKLAIMLIDENGSDPNKEAVHQRLQEDGRTSMLVLSTISQASRAALGLGDASRFCQHFEVGTASSS